MSPHAIIALAVTVAVGLSGIAASRALRARSEARVAKVMYERTRRAAAEVLTLRSTRPTVSVGKRPEPGIYGQFTDALVRAGEPTSVLTNLSPDADSSVTIEGTAARKRQRVRVTLEGITLPGLGRVMNAWRTAQPEWTVTQVQLTPASSGDPAPGLVPRPLRVALLMEATYLEHPGAAPP